MIYADLFCRKLMPSIQYIKKCICLPFTLRNGYTEQNPISTDLNGRTSIDFNVLGFHPFSFYCPHITLIRIARSHMALMTSEQRFLVSNGKSGLGVLSYDVDTGVQYHQGCCLLHLNQNSNPLEFYLCMQNVPVSFTYIHIHKAFQIYTAYSDV